MEYNLASILQQLSTIYFDDIEGYFTIQELWKWMLFDQENSYLNESLQIHKPSGVPIKERSVKLPKNITILGNYYYFKHIGHQPSYHLKKVESADDLVNEILGKSGITNMFTTVITTIIKGEVVCFDKKTNLTKVEIKLIREIQQIISCLTNSNFNELARQGHASLIKFKELEISQQNMYDSIHFISQIYQTLNLDYKRDLADELLDYISGYIGNNNLWIWDKPLEW